MVLIGEGDIVPQAFLDDANNVVALSARTPPRTIELRRMSPEVARTRNADRIEQYLSSETTRKHLLEQVCFTF
jgi:hypothetical protein